jgi:tetratricopeptide (TPR) repeat protein
LTVRSIGEGMNMKMKNFGSRIALAVLFSTPLLLAAQATTGKIHGTVSDPAGSPENGGTLALFEGGMASPTAEPKYTFQVDPNGTYKGDVTPGSYTMVYRRPETPKDKVVDQIDNIKVTAGGDTLQDDDMSRKEYLDKLSPEERKTLEETKAKNAAILKENSTIKNLNGDLAKARSDRANKNFAEAAELMQKDVALKPTEALLWVELGQSQLGLKQYSDAETSLQKGIQLDAAGKKPNPDVEGAAGNGLGEAYGSEGKIPEAQAAYDAAAKVNPAGASMYYSNEAIVMDRNNQLDATVAAAEKAIAADPTKPIPYYLKGKALINKATIDPKTQKIVAPPGTAEAYQKYLDLAPTGPFAGDAKQVLAELSQTQSTSYKASSAKKPH